MRRLIAFALAFSLVGGCSFALVSGPPANHRQLPVVDCTSSRLGPGLDTVWAALHTLNLAFAASTTDQKWDDSFDGEPPFSRTTAIGVYAGLAALGAAGMYYGFTRTGACREAKAELAVRAHAAPTGTWPPPASTPAAAPTPPTPAAPTTPAAPATPAAQPAPNPVTAPAPASPPPLAP